MNLDAKVVTCDPPTPRAKSQLVCVSKPGRSLRRHISTRMPKRDKSSGASPLRNDIVEVVEFMEEEDRPNIPLSELPAMLSGSRQHEEDTGEGISSEPSADEELLLSEGARATLPHQR